MYYILVTLVPSIWKGDFVPVIQYVTTEAYP